MEELFQTNTTKGQTLIEVVVALGASVAIIAAITVSVLAALGNIQFSKFQNLAQFYAEGVETMRRIRDTDWTVYSTYLGTPGTVAYFCLAKGQTIPTARSGGTCNINIDLGENGKFIREIQVVKDSPECRPVITPPAPDSVKGTKIYVNVGWFDSKCSSATVPCHNVTLVSCLSDAQLIPTP